MVLGYFFNRLNLDQSSLLDEKISYDRTDEEGNEVSLRGIANATVLELKTNMQNSGN